MNNVFLNLLYPCTSEVGVVSTRKIWEIHLISYWSRDYVTRGFKKSTTSYVLKINLLSWGYDCIALYNRTAISKTYSKNQRFPSPKVRPPPFFSLFLFDFHHSLQSFWLLMNLGGRFIHVRAGGALLSYHLRSRHLSHDCFVVLVDGELDIGEILQQSSELTCLLLYSGTVHLF